jgi:iron complex outermembrane recepter protein
MLRLRAAQRPLVPTLALLAVAPLCSAAETPPDEAPASDRAATADVEAGGRIIVTGAQEAPDYRAYSTSVATKLDTPLLEVPQSVTVQDRRFLKDIGATSTIDAYDYVVGISAQGSTNAGPGYARGFDIGWYDIRRDGLRTFAWSVREPFLLEKTQYLRGPSSVLYGDGSPGALLNQVLKKPLPQARYEAGVQLGSFGYQRVEADATGPLNDDGSVLYRLIGVGEEADLRYDNDERRVTLMPTVAWDAGPRTTITADCELYYETQRGFGGTALPFASGEAEETNLDFNPAEPGDRWWNANVSPGLRVDHQFSEAWALHAAGRVTWIAARYGIHTTDSLAADQTTIERSVVNGQYDWYEYLADSFVTGNIGQGAVRQRVVAGGEFGLSTSKGFWNSAAAPGIDLRHPAYGNGAVTPPGLSPDSTSSEILRLGLYVLDEVRLGDRFSVVPGLRWSFTRNTDEAADLVQTDRDISPRLGVVFKADPSWSLYASYVNSFQPPWPGSVDASGSAIDPVVTDAYEVGTKADLLDDTLTTTLAAYYMVRRNVATWAGGYYDQTGEAVSQGVEWELDGTLRPGWTLTVGYAWNQTEITDDAVNGREGLELTNAPQHQGSVWTKYVVQRGAAAGWGAGLGAVYEGTKWVDQDNTLKLESWWRFDTGIYYENAASGWEGSLVMRNVLDEDYIQSAWGDAGATPGEARNVTLSVTKVW